LIYIYEILGKERRKGENIVLSISSLERGETGNIVVAYFNHKGQKEN
jgi:hypothetical protein